MQGGAAYKYSLGPVTDHLLESQFSCLRCGGWESPTQKAALSSGSLGQLSCLCLSFPC